MGQKPTQIPITEFALAERVSIDVIRDQAAEVAHIPLTAEALNGVLNYVFILNPQRQIVFASDNVRDLLPGGNGRRILGERPGELLGCVHSEEAEGGCGTSIFCQECGAAKAILSSLAGRRNVQECHLTRMVNCGEEALDLLVAGTPFPVGKETYSLMAIVDISHLKRRRALEQIFFHDLINYAGGLERLTDMLTEAPTQEVTPDMRTDLQVLQNGFHEMMEEIRAQKDLAAAENGELAVRFTRVTTNAILGEIVQMFQKHPVAEARALRLAPDIARADFSTDPVLLKRVLGNLLKNALEATPRGQTVLAGGEDHGKRVRFWIRNPGVMPKSVQLQVFNRSFSTKGAGRGLGTYSVRLLTERYLNGTAGFTTHEEEGTTFFVTLPKEVNSS